MSFDFQQAICAIDFGSPAILDSIFAGGGTITGWIFPRTAGEADFGRILDKSSNNISSDGWALFVDGATGGNVDSINFAHDFSTTLGRWLTPAASISFNVWQHVAISYDNSAVGNNPIILIDGVVQTLTETTPVGTAVTDAAEILTMGNQSPTNVIRTFDGIMEDMRIYDRLLTTQEMQNIAFGEGIDGIVDGLIAWWPLGDLEADISGQDLFMPGTLTTIGASTTITLPVDDDVKDGDDLIMIIATSGDATPENLTTPSGWSLVVTGDAPGTISTPSLWVFRRSASSEPASYVVTGNQTTTKIGVITSVRGPVTVDVAGTPNTGDSTAPISNGVTATANSVAYHVSVSDDTDVVENGSAAHPAGVNCRYAVSASGSGNGVALIISTELVDSGATGTRTFALTDGEQWVAVSFVLIGAQGATAQYVRDYSNNAVDSRLIAFPQFRRERPPIRTRRTA